MRFLQKMILVGGLITSGKDKGLSFCSTATAVRPEGHDAGSSGSNRHADTNGAASVSTVVLKDPKKKYPRRHQPECRRVSFDYQQLVKDSFDISILPHDISFTTGALAPVTRNLSPQSKSEPKKMGSKDVCYKTCEAKTNAFRDQLLKNLKTRNHPFACWDTSDVSIIGRKGIAIEQYCPNDCTLPIFCMCQLRLIIHHQYNATSSEMRIERLRHYLPSNYVSICDFRKFSDDLGGAMLGAQAKQKESGAMKHAQAKQKEFSATKHPLFVEWKLIPDSAKVLETVQCPTLSQQNDQRNEEEGAPAAGAPARKRPKLGEIKEVCYCNSVDGKKSALATECLHSQLSCWTTTYEQVLLAIKHEELTTDMLEIYTEVFPQIATDLLEPLPSAAIGNEQVDRRVFDSLLPQLPDLNERLEGHDEF